MKGKERGTTLALKLKRPEMPLVRRPPIDTAIKFQWAFEEKGESLDRELFDDLPAGGGGTKFPPMKWLFGFEEGTSKKRKTDYNRGFVPARTKERPAKNIKTLKQGAKRSVPETLEEKVRSRRGREEKKDFLSHINPPLRGGMLRPAGRTNNKVEWASTQGRTESEKEKTLRIRPDFASQYEKGKPGGQRLFAEKKNASTTTSTF